VGTAKTISVAGISIAGADSNNYSPVNATASATADITIRGLTVSATADDKIYDGNATAIAHLSDNRVSGDTFAEAYTAASFPDKTVAPGRTVSITGISISGGDAGNYNLSATTATAIASITARPLVVTATGLSRKYDGTTAATVTLSDNRLAGDVFTAIYTGASFADKERGYRQVCDGGWHISHGSRRRELCGEYDHHDNRHYHAAAGDDLCRCRREDLRRDGDFQCHTGAFWRRAGGGRYGELLADV
jgi:hypothetical protein